MKKFVIICGLLAGVFLLGACSDLGQEVRNSPLAHACRDAWRGALQALRDLFDPSPPPDREADRSPDTDAQEEPAWRGVCRRAVQGLKDFLDSCFTPEQGADQPPSGAAADTAWEGVCWSVRPGRSGGLSGS